MPRRLSGKLLQLAGGAVYGEDKQVLRFHERKLDALEDLIEAATGKPLLVAYWYRHDLERIRERFDARPIATARDIADWNAGKIAVGLIHPASAGHGLNLQEGGSTLIWFTPTWSWNCISRRTRGCGGRGREAGRWSSATSSPEARTTRT